MLFEPIYCNQLLKEMIEAFPHSIHGPKHMEMEPSPYAKIMGFEHNVSTRIVEKDK